MSRECPNGCDAEPIEEGRDDEYYEDGGSEITYYRCPECGKRWEDRYEF